MVGAPVEKVSVPYSMNESQSNGVSGNSYKGLFLHISATKVVASWTLFIGIFIMVLDVFFQDSNIPERQMLKKYQGQDTGGKKLTDPCQTASVRA